MQKQIELEGQLIAYTLKPNKRSRSLRITVHGDQLLVTFPARMPQHLAEQFLSKQSSWILDQVNKFKKLAQTISPYDKLQPYAKAKKQALYFVKQRVEILNNFYDFTYHSISVRNQKTRWGSCSSRGVLSFNYRLIGLPLHLVDYVIVHELCHLKEMNHSAKFWALMAQTLPNYRQLRRELKKSPVGLI